MSSDSDQSQTSSPQSDQGDKAPPLSQEGRQEANRIVEGFRKNLTAIASCIALDAGSKKVIEPHVRHAHDTLRRCALTPKHPLKLWQTPEASITAGSILIGASFSIASLAKDIIEADKSSLSSHPYLMWAFVIVLPGVVALGGAFLLGYGWTHRTPT
jgi:hypothetical protein